MTARMTIPLCLFLALAASACGSAQTERGAQPPGARPPTVYTVGRTLLGLPGHDRVTLAAAPVTPLAGWLTPVAVPSPDGRFVAYNTWRELREEDPALSWEDQGISAGDPLARPSIRVHDLQTGTDSAYVVGAFSLAWRGDGAIAYFKGANRDYRAGVRYVGDVFVRDSVNAPPRRWTEQTDRYVVAGWAGPSLLVYRVRAGEALDVLALDGPGKRRVLASDAGLVAISPDGTSALVEYGPETGPPRVDLIAVSNGTKLASLDVSTVDPAVGVVGYAGDWQGDLVAAPSASGLVVFRIAGGRIELARTMRAAAGHGRRRTPLRRTEPRDGLDELVLGRRVRRLRSRFRPLRPRRPAARRTGRRRLSRLASPRLQPEPPAGRRSVRCASHCSRRSSSAGLWVRPRQPTAGGPSTATRISTRR